MVSTSKKRKFCDNENPDDSSASEQRPCSVRSKTFEANINNCRQATTKGLNNNRPQDFSRNRAGPSQGQSKATLPTFNKDPTEKKLSKTPPKVVKTGAGSTRRQVHSSVAFPRQQQAFERDEKDFQVDHEDDQKSVFVLKKRRLNAHRLVDLNDVHLKPNMRPLNCPPHQGVEKGKLIPCLNVLAASQASTQTPNNTQPLCCRTIECDI